MEKSRCEALQRKIREGVPVDQAALELGLTPEETAEIFEQSLKYAMHDDAALKIAAASALEHGLRRLIKVAQEPPRTSQIFESDGQTTTRTNIESSDVDAAKALLKFALDARKILAVKKDGGTKAVQGELLFPEDDRWDLKE